MCPHLSRFVFDEKVLHPAADHYKYGRPWYNHSGRVAPKELAAILSAWPKVLSIFICRNSMVLICIFLF